MAEYATGGAPLNPRWCPADEIAIAVNAGFTPDSAWDAVTRGDITLLRHSGTIHVQLEPPHREDPDDGSAGVPAKV